MTQIDVHRLVRLMRKIESVALLDRTVSTNAVARRVVTECIENDIPLPSAAIVAKEQTGGRGRGSRSWYSPAGRGIYATALHTRPVETLGYLPLEIATVIAGFLRETYDLDAKIKWPNDILVDGNKIAGILIEARIHGPNAYTLIGTGINIEPLGTGAPEGSVSVGELTHRQVAETGSATQAFLEYLDRRLHHPREREEVLDEWRRRTVHSTGDRIVCTIGDRKVAGSWGGIDENGSAMLRTSEGTVYVSGGELIIAEPASPGS
jgi:BirA family transcriptional regulator, biotin operon repressor / biotin---[acetyl-CoA-carboxylase] ligase